MIPIRPAPPPPLTVQPSRPVGPSTMEASLAWPGEMYPIILRGIFKEPAYHVSRLSDSSSSDISSPSNSSLLVSRTLQICRGVPLVDLGRSRRILEMLPG